MKKRRERREGGKEELTEISTTDEN